MGNVISTPAGAGNNAMTKSRKSQPSDSDRKETKKEKKNSRLLCGFPWRASRKNPDQNDQDEDATGETNEVTYAIRLWAHKILLSGCLINREMFLLSLDLVHITGGTEGISRDQQIFHITLCDNRKIKVLDVTILQGIRGTDNSLKHYYVLWRSPRTKYICLLSLDSTTGGIEKGKLVHQDNLLDVRMFVETTLVGSEETKMELLTETMSFAKPPPQLDEISFYYHITEHNVRLEKVMNVLVVKGKHPNDDTPYLHCEDKDTNDTHEQKMTSWIYPEDLAECTPNIRDSILLLQQMHAELLNE